MPEFKFVMDYKNDGVLRKSFFELAAGTFGINFDNWYEQGFWTERYIPYSYAEGDKVVANVSVNLLDLIVEGERKRAAQIGTVMTHPDYRRRGLSASLMNKVLEEYEHKCDLMYLFANDTVLDFYPKFGFEAVEEHQFSIDFTPDDPDPAGIIRKLNVDQADDLSLICELASARRPVSQRLGTDNALGILMFYCLNVFRNDIYYLEKEKVIVIYKRENNQIDLFDIIHQQEINLHEILSKIAGSDTEKIVFSFTPDCKDMDIESKLLQGELLFVRSHGDNHYPVHVKHPMTSIA